MISLVLAIATAAVWGTADFCGGKASQRAPALTVSVWSKTASLPVLAVALAVAPGRPDPASLGWGALGGLFGMAGVILLYRGLALGAMTIVAPVTAVTSALVPFAVGMVTDGTAGLWPTVGAACAIAAIALVSTGPGSTGPGGDRSVVRAGVVGLALAAGTGFGLFMTFLSRAGDDAGLWPLTTAQAAALLLGFGLLSRARPRDLGRFRAPFHTESSKITGILTVLAGVLDLSANVLYLYATHTGGPLTIVAPLASLYPASTVLLALAVDREKIRPLQLAGLGLAATALVLVAG